MSLIQRDGAYKVHLANFAHQVGGAVQWGGGRVGRVGGLHFEKKGAFNKVGNGERKSIRCGRKCDRVSPRRDSRRAENDGRSSSCQRRRPSVSDDKVSKANERRRMRASAIDGPGL